ncbi:MAG: MATE family efflux transporter [Bacteroidetes bacterium]|uniref:Multidrug export protein MepA n=1 Tax=Candidatus Cryptobacteroides intestinigallinarum TaxID=2840767 RepID=A0A9D9HLB4_9BACT|nr:MATE family efflux transporter [Candidatus Cryptobacteroides intestinigallinarum]
MAEKSAIPVELGTEPIGKLLKNYAVPAIIAMTASSLYNIIDSIFIGHGVGPLAIAGLAVTFPLMNLSAAFGTLVGVGATTLVSVLLGQKNYEVANKVLGNVVILNTVIGLLFMTAALVFLDPILYFFGASENTIIYAREYMRIILAGNAITHLYLGLNSVLRASGQPKMAMFLTILSVLINTAVAPVLIFGLDMGISGAAIATVLAQTVSLAVILKHFSNQEGVLHFSRKIFRIDWRIAKDSLAIGLAPFLMNSAACIVTLFINQQLKKYGGDLAIGAYGIVNRISFLFIMINMGFNQGMQPIAGYNYGRRNYTRVKAVMWTTVKYATAVTCTGFLIAMFFPHQAVSIFTSDPQLIEFASKGLRMLTLAFPFVGFQMVSSNFFQCLGMVNKAILLSMSRQILFLIPCVYILPRIFGNIGVWISFPIADFAAFVIAAVLMAGILRKFRKLNDGDDPSILGSKL